MEKKYKLLIVDDEQGILDVYSSYFAKQDFEVDVAHNGVEGLEKLRQGEFDVALVDIRMPKMDGLELARQVIDEGIDTSIIILTAHGERDDAVQALNAGVDAWFDKPNIKMKELLTKVRDLAQVIPPEEMNRILSVIPD